MADIPQVREKYLMSTQGERLAALVTGAVVFCFCVFMLVRLSEAPSEGPGVVDALAACKEQPTITVRTYTGPADDPGRYSEDQLSAVERDKYVIDAVSKCRSEVLEFFARTAPSAPHPDTKDR